ncbi:MAG: hypothetical protein H9W81_13820 [Enterococcus sp.]|nr:hypothetical protein [Enterococcus sp.]
MDITNKDYVTDSNGDICLKPEIALTVYWDFVEAFVKLADGHRDPLTGRKWSCEVVYGDNFLERGVIPLVSIPQDEGYSYYTVEAGPVPLRTPEDVLSNDYAETFVSLVKVDYANKVLTHSEYPRISAYLKGRGAEGKYNAVSWSVKALEAVSNTHAMYLKALPLHRRIRSEGMI